MSLSSGLEPSEQAKLNSQRTTATGTVKVGLARIVAAVTGLVLHGYLARALQLELYGMLAVVTSVIVWWELGRHLLDHATARFVAKEKKWERVAGTAVQMTALWALILMVPCVVTAPLMAQMLNDMSLLPYLWLFSIDLPLFSLYQTFRAILHGRRKYGQQAVADICYWIAKAGLMSGLVALGFSVTGAVVGSIGASVVGLAVAWWWSQITIPRRLSIAKDLVIFGLPLMIIPLIMQIIQTMDLWCVKAAVQSEQAPGYYGAAKFVFQMARLLPVAVSSAIFPTLTQAISRNNEDSCRELITQSFRFVFVITLAGIALVCCCAKDVVTLMFSTLYAPAAVPAAILMVAALTFSLWGISYSIMIAAGKPSRCLLALIPLLPVNIALNVLLVPRYELIGAAISTMITGTLWQA